MTSALLSSSPLRSLSLSSSSSSFSSWRGSVTSLTLPLSYSHFSSLCPFQFTGKQKHFSSSPSYSSSLPPPPSHSPSLSLSSSTPFVDSLPTSHNPFRTLRGVPQDKLLFTPGPLTTSFNVKSQMLCDLGSRDFSFISIIKSLRSSLLSIVSLPPTTHTVIPMQGSGTFGVEAAIETFVPKTGGGILVLANGAYGHRMFSIAQKMGIKCFLYAVDESEIHSEEKIQNFLNGEAKGVTHVGVIHSETTSGVINNISQIGKIVKSNGKRMIVDGMSSVGGIPVDFSSLHFDVIVSSSNKCVEGVPGFSFAIANKEILNTCKGNSSSVSLDFENQWRGLEDNGQFRFTPPTHSLMAFHEAIKELIQEGGVEARHRRYRKNREIVTSELIKLGYHPFLREELRGPIISSFHWPTDSNWDFHQFYTQLHDRGFVIYPGKVSKANCFRIGHIGRIFPEDSRELTREIERVSKEMKTAKFFKEK